MNVKIISFGYLHGEPPAADITLDLRHHFRDPHVSPELRYMNAYDVEVQNAVMNTAGIPTLLGAVALAVKAFRSGPSGGTVTVAVGCAGGRHRAATFAMRLAAQVGTVHVSHRDLSKAVVERSTGERV